MKADPFDQLRLLDVQELDAGLHRLQVRRAGLPAHAVISAADAALDLVRDELVGHETRSSDLGRAAQRLEADIDQVRARSTRDRQRLDAGSVSSARELESLQSEITSLGRRQAALEDEELELLEGREQADAAAVDCRRRQQELTAQRQAAVSERDRELASLDEQAARLAAQRAELAAQLPAELLALYDRLRAERAGVGAAALVRRRCEGCHLELAGNELAQVRALAPEEVHRHEDCGRILVRTADSGL